MSALFDEISRLHPAAAEPGASVLLTEYVGLVEGADVLHQAIAAAWEGEGIGPRYIALTALLDVRLARMVQLATALRLTQSQRFRADAVKAKPRSRQPWRRE